MLNDDLFGDPGVAGCHIEEINPIWQIADRYGNLVGIGGIQVAFDNPRAKPVKQLDVEYLGCTVIDLNIHVFSTRVGINLSIDQLHDPEFILG